MTPSLPKVAEMSDEEIRIAVAEGCGFERQQSIEGVRVWKRMGHPLAPVEMLPDYCRDLDVMASAEDSLAPDQRPGYITKLRKVLMTDDGISDWDIAHATAKQRASAFLLATGRARA